MFFLGSRNNGNESRLYEDGTYIPSRQSPFSLKSLKPGVMCARGRTLLSFFYFLPKSVLDPLQAYLLF